MSVDLIVGGASKAGTTALYDMLRQRPDFFLPKRKELHYFSRPFIEGTTNGPGDAAVLAEIPDTLDTYFAHFADKRPGQIAVDVSPSYLFHHASAAAIERELPSVKIVFILRRPEEKVFSQYTHLVGEGRETMSFEDALGAEANRKAAGYSDIWLYAESGYYADAVMAFQAALGPGRTMIVLFDDFRRDPGSVLRDICLFVGLDGRQEFRTELESNVSGAPRSVLLARLIGPNAFTNLLRRILPSQLGRIARRALRAANSAGKPILNPETRNMLKGIYAEDISRLETLIGRKTGWLTPKE